MAQSETFFVVRTKDGPRAFYATADETDRLIPLYPDGGSRHHADFLSRLKRFSSEDGARTYVEEYEKLRPGKAGSLVVDSASAEILELIKDVESVRQR